MIAQNSLIDNLAAREQAFILSSPTERRAMLQACASDVVLWCNLYAWTYDPRLDIKGRPFLLYPCQAEALRDIRGAIGRHDALVEKSRDMGATWLCIAAFVHDWLFTEQSPLTLVSRKEDLVDKSGDPDCLFWKADYILENLPSWMRPKLRRNSMHLENLSNGSVIDGESTTGDVARGGRRRAIMLDEFASVETGAEVLAATADATPCRLFVSTPKGVGNAFYERRQSQRCQIITLHWSQHPVKAEGLYYEGGKPRSPWYDAECQRRGSLREIAQELDIDYLSSGSMFFDSSVLTRIKTRDVREPDTVHAWIYGGRAFDLRLWCALGEDGRPSQDCNYVIAADVSFGQGASESPISIYETTDRHKVGELVTGDLSPHELARVMFDLAGWFGGQSGRPFLIWEANGPGLIVGKELLRLGYGFIYYQQREESTDNKRSRVPGWHSSRDGKTLLLSDYRRALATGDVTTHSAQSVEQCWEYVIAEDGSIGPARLQDKGAGARALHGDSVIADALGYLGLREQPKARPEPAIIPEMSMAAREQKRKAEEARKREGVWE